MSCPKCFTTAVSLDNGEGFYTCGWCGQDYFIAEICNWNDYGTRLMEDDPNFVLKDTRKWRYKHEGD